MLYFHHVFISYYSAYPRLDAIMSMFGLVSSSGPVLVWCWCCCCILSSWSSFFFVLLLAKSPKPIPIFLGCTRTMNPTTESAILASCCSYSISHIPSMHSPSLCFSYSPHPSHKYSVSTVVSSSASIGK